VKSEYKPSTRVLRGRKIKELLDMWSVLGRDLAEEKRFQPEYLVMSTGSFGSGLPRLRKFTSIFGPNV
jgi:hypothetical protein